MNDGTTFLERLKDLLPERYIAPQQTGELAIQGLASGICNAIAGGVQDVSPTSVVEVGEYTGPYENGVNRFSKDPLALVTRQGEFYIIHALHLSFLYMSHIPTIQMILNGLHLYIGLFRLYFTPKKRELQWTHRLACQS